MHGTQNTNLNACTLSAKNAYVLVHARICNGAEASLPWNQCELILSFARASCRLSLPLAQLLSRLNQSPDAVRSRHPFKSTLAHDAVAATVSHKHRSIICVRAGLIQFVYKSHSRLATELPQLHFLWFSQAFWSRHWSLTAANWVSFDFNVLLFLLRLLLDKHS